MTREPLVMDTESLDSIEEIVESLAEGYHVLGGDTPEKQAKYEQLLTEIREARPDFEQS